MIREDAHVEETVSFTVRDERSGMLRGRGRSRGEPRLFPWALLGVAFFLAAAGWVSWRLAHWVLS